MLCLIVICVTVVVSHLIIKKSIIIHILLSALKLFIIFYISRLPQVHF